MVNRHEQQALVGLMAALLVGSIVALSDWFWTGTLEEFRVVPRAAKQSPALELALVEPVPVSLNSATVAERVALPSADAKTAALIAASTALSRGRNSCSD